MDKSIPEAVVDAVARAICVACEDNPDRKGDARGNDFRWQDYRDVALAAISAFTAAQQQPVADALETAREDGWQPIETAPKDGTHVLLWYEWHDLPVVGDFRYGRWWSVHSLGGNLPHPNGMDWEKAVRPTYWRPLPAPPALAAHSKQGDEQ